MTVQLANVRFFVAGYCTQFGYLTGISTWKLHRFYALFVYFEHPEYGPSLIDTGYSEHFYPATKNFPQRMFRWLLPTRISPEKNAASQLRRAGIDPGSIQRIFITHFHIDHIGGLKCFPQATFIYRPETFEALQRATHWQQLHHGYLCSLIPESFIERSQPLPTPTCFDSASELNELRVYDYWGDMSLRLVDLPGHALGQMGAVLKGEDQDVFYIVDACWNLKVLRSGGQLPWFVRGTQHDYTTYLQTQQKLQSLEEKYLMLACHCPESLEYVQKTQD